MNTKYIKTIIDGHELEVPAHLMAEMTLAVAEAIVRKRAVSWIAYSNGDLIINSRRKLLTSH